MKNGLLKILFFCIFINAFYVLQVSASTGHNHESNSPFDKQKQLHELHCELNRHHLMDKICPHKTTKEAQKKLVITMDCGGSTSGVVSLFGPLTSHYLLNVVCSNFGLLLNTYYTVPFLSGLESYCPRMIYHPPKTV